MDHLIKNRTTLLPRFLGAYTIKMYGIEIHFVITLNLFPKNTIISERYDLKGSWIDRNSPVDNSKFLSKRTSGKSPLYKDNDLKEAFNLEPNIADEMVNILIIDTNFLKGKDIKFNNINNIYNIYNIYDNFNYIERNLMDYSLLVGVTKQRYEVTNQLIPKVTYDNPLGIDKDGGITNKILNLNYILLSS